MPMTGVRNAETFGELVSGESMKVMNDCVVSAVHAGVEDGTYHCWGRLNNWRFHPARDVLYLLSKVIFAIEGTSALMKMA